MKSFCIALLIAQHLTHSLWTRWLHWDLKCPTITHFTASKIKKSEISYSNFIQNSFPSCVLTIRVWRFSFFRSLLKFKEVNQFGGILSRGQVYHVPGEGVVHVGVGLDPRVLLHVPAPQHLNWQYWEMEHELTWTLVTEGEICDWGPARRTWDCRLSLPRGWSPPDGPGPSWVSPRPSWTEREETWAWQHNVVERG